MSDTLSYEGWGGEPYRRTPTGRQRRCRVLARNRARRLVLAYIGMTIQSPVWYTERGFDNSDPRFKDAPEASARRGPWRLTRVEEKMWASYHKKYPVTCS